ncbi:DNA topoisomerase 3-alpha [Nymphaea colorata]|nr:DNA topoisomerase 3-alpha [Nymphaea colorata]
MRRGAGGGGPGLGAAGGRRLSVLNVAEKPSVARSVASILSGSGNPPSREGRSRYNRVFEFEYNIRGQPCLMLMTSVTGHLMELDFDQRYRKWHSCDPSDLFSAPVQKFVPEDKLDIKRTLEEEARKCQWLVLWLDCDREGENIAYEVIEVCTAVNPHLNILRAHFSALINREIHEAAQNLDRPNPLFADAVDVRQEIDLRIGASFTRFQTLLLGNAFNLDFAGENRNIILSYGPCQFPTLGFVVERFWEIQSHEPEEFWAINCSHDSEDGSASFTWIRGHLFDYSSALIIYEMCVEEPTATVKKVNHQEKRKYPPYPLSTVELQRRASQYFRMSSEHTMKVAEDLYQAGFISYPRTETDSFSVNTNLHAIVQEQQGHPSWGLYAQRLLDPESGLWRNPSNGGHDDKAHPPIHPTKFSAGEASWSQDHNRLYELVVRHFLACVSQPAVGAGTTVEIDIAGESFTASGLMILAKNYLDVYRFESWGGSTIPMYQLGQQFLPTTLTLDSSVTRPPPLLSESDLLGCMDKAGIGTDATMHDHIKKLLDRFYAVKDSNTRFSPTNLGEALVMGYDEMGYELWKPYLRSAMESDMKSVSVGTKRKAEVLESCLQQMKACFLDARVQKGKLMGAMEIFFERSNRNDTDDNHGQTVRSCTVCQESEMVLRRKPDGNYMVGCLRFPLCRNVVWLPGAIAEAHVSENICTTCTPGPIFKIQFKFRRMEIPPTFNVDHLGCIGGCDEILLELIETCGTGSRNPSAAPAQERRRVVPPTRNPPARNSRQVPCTHCRQVGHSASDCPALVGGPPTASGSNLGRSEILCDACQMPCVGRTANTSSNRGRKFYTCQSRDCNFFVWEDNLQNGRVGGASRNSNSSNRSQRDNRAGRGRGRQRERNAGGSFVMATGEPTERRCFVCGDPSHFANVCPNRG